MKRFGVLTDEGDCLYVYATLSDLLEANFDEMDMPDGIPDGQELIRIDAYTVLSVGSSEKFAPAPPEK